MQIINKVFIENFKCFRRQEEFTFSDGTYVIGINNAGKTSILNAIKYFFDDNLYVDESFLNRTEFLGKAAGYNKSTITIEFNLNALKTKRLKQDLIKQYGKTLQIKKLVTITAITKKIFIAYDIKGHNYTFEKLPEDIVKIIKGVKVVYIHPQEGKELLLNAQEKLKTRLLANWGRSHSSVTQSLKDIEVSWENFREKAKKYLSNSLTENIQPMWPKSEVTIDLPKNIEDIIAISDINFKTDLGPEISLTQQGTGAQATILYFAHYLLDSDRTLNRGEYHPIWLLEEPESFLHADLIIQFGKQLNSNSWLDNIQMVVSTHSPLMLAVSRSGAEKIRWNLIENYSTIKSNTSTEWLENDLEDIGKIMGDSNFYFYFLASSRENLIFIEDNKSIVTQKFNDSGIKVLKGLRGVTEIGKCIEAYSSTEEILKQKVYFIIDGDRGKENLSRFMNNQIENKDGFKKYKITNKIFIICFPDNFRAEDLFIEFDNHVEECVSKIYNQANWSFLDSVPSNLSRTHAEIRGKKIEDKEMAKNLIRNTQDVKDSFWKKVETDRLSISSAYISILKNLIK